MLSKWAFWRGARAPQTRAAEAPPRGLAEGRRVYAMGDIHGRADLLERLLDKIADDLRRRPTAHARLVFLGDYIDRGPDSRRVLDLLTGGFSFVQEAVFLCGNHEEALLAFLADPSRGAQWRQFGALEMIASYGLDVSEARLGRGFEALRDELESALGSHLQFLQDTAFSAREGGYFFCHAGVRPGLALTEQSPRDLCWIRDQFLRAEVDFGAVVVHGHTPVEAVDIRRNRINVDTGAYMTHRLSCAVLETGTVGVLDTQDV